MKKFNMHRHPDGRIEAVKEGFSWPAFLFIGFWALAKKMYLLSAIAFGASVVIGMVVGWEWMYYILTTIMGVVFGVQGNAWREMTLAARGFDAVGAEVAETPDGAVAAYLKRKKIPTAPF